MGCGSSSLEQNPGTFDKTISRSLTTGSMPSNHLQKSNPIKNSLSIEKLKGFNFLPTPQHSQATAETSIESLKPSQEIQTEPIEYKDSQTNGLETEENGEQTLNSYSEIDPEKWKDKEIQTENEFSEEVLGIELRKMYTNLNIGKENSNNQEILGTIESIVEQWRRIDGEYLNTQTEPDLYDNSSKHEDSNNVSVSTLVSEATKASPTPKNKSGVKVVTKPLAIKTKISYDAEFKKNIALVSPKDENLDARLSMRAATLKLMKSTSPTPEHILRNRFEEAPRKQMSPFPFLKKRKSIESKPLSVFDPLRFKIQERMTKPNEKNPLRMSLNEEMLGGLFKGALTPDLEK